MPLAVWAFLCSLRNFHLKRKIELSISDGEDNISYSFLYYLAVVIGNKGTWSRANILLIAI